MVLFTVRDARRHFTTIHDMANFARTSAQYALLLRELRKYTPETDVSFSNVVLAEDIVTKVCLNHQPWQSSVGKEREGLNEE